MTGKPGSDDEGSATKKPKRTGPSLLQLERDKYMRGGAVSRGGKGKRRAGAGEEEDVLDALAGFRSKLSEAAKAAPKAGGLDEEGDEEAEAERRRHGIDLNEDELDDDVRTPDGTFLAITSLRLTFPGLPFAFLSTRAILPCDTARRLDVPLSQVPQRRDPRPTPSGRVRRRRPAREEQYDPRRDARQGG